MKQVYILLSRTGTLPSKLIHSLVHGKFTHASIAVEPRTNGFYSFARRSMHNIFNGGLIAEDVHTRIFALYPDCNCALYALDVSDEAYGIICRKIEYYWNNYDRCKYNYFGVIPSGLGIVIKRKFKFTCSQFVSSLLYDSGAVSLPKNPWVMKPNDFLDVCGMKLLYEGHIGECRFPENTDTAEKAVAQEVQ